ncbi:hypothetical protein JCM21714_4701 [Gracilibacillus boraciitolerans JCM 21714]|uniref:Yip1 domain-containing protein n=1 Tax=Gracilibacillus boraciitolerans JCM 21714 TaxID=1298598 RepID=W4VQF9_9BACI|nr:hypothetical protein [Gracilibacillus boraciitolerans]GAE95457.1 hypothetical protein JCM21714_4701 [Gracilibacillus boraciitolerans JCM 21714]
MVAVTKDTILLKPSYSIPLLIVVIVLSTYVQFGNVLNLAIDNEIVSQDIMSTVENSKGGLLFLISFVFQLFIMFPYLILETITVYFAAFMAYKQRWELRTFFFTSVEATIVTMTLNLILSFTILSLFDNFNLQDLIIIYLVINLLKPILVYYLLTYKKILHFKLSGLLMIYVFTFIVIFSPGLIFLVLL